MTTIRFRRGNKTNLPASAPSGTPLWCEDSKEFYMGTGTGVQKVGSDGGSSVPIGTVLPWPSITIPDGHFECNGQAISRTTFSELFAVLGTSFGSGDGITTFNVPDLRAEFIRGLDRGRGIDVNRLLGSSQADDFKSHTHTITSIWDNGGTSGLREGGGTQRGNVSTNAAGGTETRPRNVALVFIIKAKSSFFDPAIQNANADTLDGYHATDLLSQLTPYSVISGPQNASGYADFISKIDNNSVSVKGVTTNIVVVYPDFSKETINTNITVSSIVDNLTTKFIKEKGNITIQKCTGTITESILPPSGGIDGDYWLCIGIKPYKGYKRVSGAWTPMQFVKLGEVIKTSGTLGTPVSYAFNRYYIEYDITAPLVGSSIVKNHNVGSDKVTGKAYAQCIIADQGYAVGDIIDNWNEQTQANNNSRTDLVRGNIGQNLGVNKLTASFTRSSIGSYLVPKGSVGNGDQWNPYPLDWTKWKLIFKVEVLF